MNHKSGYPYFLIKTGLIAAYLKLQFNKTTNVVVIGWDISGSLSAYHLLQKGISCIVVVLRSIGPGISCASTSLLQYEIDTPLHKLVESFGKNYAIRSYQLRRSIR